jgi:hypothetical protein
MPSNEEGIVLTMWAANLTDACYLPSAQGGLPRGPRKAPPFTEKDKKKEAYEG